MGIAEIGHLTKKIDDINIRGMSDLISPELLRLEIPLSQNAKETVWRGRQTIENILSGKDSRHIIVCGPCSIHDPKSAIEYAEKLKNLSEKIADKYFIVMRVYFEKPRSTTGWKGLINDPYLDDSFQISHGLKIARQLLLSFNDIGIACAGEALDPIIPQYLSDLYSWCAIGARTSESQTHREMASGLSMPVGIKNGTDGNLDNVVNAMLAVSKPHSFLGIRRDGKCCVVHTKGNNYSHLILRGGAQPNYSAEHIINAENKLITAGLRPKIMVDCSHANSGKDAMRQPIVFREVIKIAAEHKAIVGCMLESNLSFGNQQVNNRHQLKYGISITDACMDWQMTEKLLLE